MKRLWLGMVSTVTALTALCAGGSAARAACEYPRMLVVLDKSSSMNTTIAANVTKWSAARTAVTSTVTANQSGIHFGLMLFPDPNLCGPGAIKVDIGANTAASMSSYLATAPPAGGNYTPMSQSLDVAANYSPLLTGPQRNYVLLITDGWQWCDPYDPATRFLPVDAVKRLRAKNVKTYVVGFGSAVDPLTLNKMAYEGGTAPPGCNAAGSDPAATNLCYFQANSQTALNSALTEIARQTSAETCDGQDNDCDGYADNAVPGNPAPLTKSCSSACGGGLSTCTRGLWSACNAPLPVPETCDGQDNDCDGYVDNAVRGNPAPLTRACSSTCGGGVERCEAGRWVGCSAPPPQVETCDGRDNDCDGYTDNAVTGHPAPLTRPCATACGSGVESCRAGAWQGCTAPPVGPEICGDNIDNNCDGRVDEGCECSPGDRRACGADIGECLQGMQGCTADGRWGDCVSGRSPAAEICDGKDNDCDGVIDNGAICTGEGTCACGGCANPCRNGECPQGARCTGGFCVVDRCQPGFHCEWTKCVEGTAPTADGGADGGATELDGGVVVDAGAPVDPGPVVAPGSPPGCNCSTNASSTPLPLGLFLLVVGLWLVRRRVRTSHR